jgi:hypothetical protein
LLRAVESGDVLSLTRQADNVLRATFIRDLLRSADFHPRGLMISGARITGWLDLDFMTTVPLTLSNCVLDDVSMCDAEIPAVDLSRSAVSELRASGLRTRSFEFIGGQCTFLFDLHQADVRGNVRLDMASIETLRAPDLRVGGSLAAGRLHVRPWYHERDAIRLDGCDIGGDLDLDEAVVTGLGGVLRGAGHALTLPDTDAGGLDITGAVLRGVNDTALRTDGSHFRGDVRVATTRATTERTGATISLSRTSIGGSLLVGEPDLLRNLGDVPRLDLSGTEVGRELVLDAAEWAGAVAVDGLTYPNAPQDTDAWLTMLRDHTPAYAPQPYRQLAAVHRAAGHEHAAREVLIAQQEDLRHRGDPGNRVWHRFLGVTLGYGYRPARAVAGLLVTFLLAIGLVWTAGELDGLSPAPDRPAGSCSPVNRISLAADLALPLVRFGGTPRCELANGPAGQWATGAGWVLQLLGWSFAALGVAGCTGLVRKS